MFGLFGNNYDDSYDYQYAIEQQQARQRRAEAHRGKQAQQELYQRQQEEHLRRQEQQSARAYEQHRAQREREEKARRMAQREEALQHLFTALPSQPNRFDQGTIQNGTEALTPGAAFKTYDSQNKATGSQMRACDAASQQTLRRSGDEYCATVPASSRAATRVRADAQGTLEVTADGRVHRFQLPEFADRSSIRAAFADGCLTVRLAVPEDPREDVFLVQVE
ncbi:Hsp20/alpha crystallin family protein [Spironucleus salmonicida]|uniref:Hsp20/alpha crystallin family protein n=1 Tax=Spironucleus salmonicida TaxID=348837 RepID=V6LPG3_9EUKA|nr:Hsp20/alpha crystallin family protein [Spironucleus salmonicida]KAH0577106.1 Hsp20/alpha crystallin family protein [Spironucleus salmonicida]|eukprot:EST45601.1 Hsp20/alpha crystallin family protein [Spironucleus salmonicida]